MNTHLTPAEEETMRVAAHGVVGLMASADPGPIASARAGIAGGKALSTATGLVGLVLARAPLAKLKGTVAEVASVVLPALTDTVRTLDAKAPREADNFRRTIGTIVDTAARGRAKATYASMAAKITEAMAAR